jgi:hypothetical protein
MYVCMCVYVYVCIYVYVYVCVCVCESAKIIGLVFDTLCHNFGSSDISTCVTSNSSFCLSP